MVGEYQSARRKTCCSVTLSIKNLKWFSLGFHLGLCGQKLATSLRYTTSSSTMGPFTAAVPRDPVSLHPNNERIATDHSALPLTQYLTVSNKEVTFNNGLCATHRVIYNLLEVINIFRILI
jgi:hypothetical protein